MIKYHPLSRELPVSICFKFDIKVLGDFTIKRLYILLIALFKIYIIIHTCIFKLVIIILEALKIGYVTTNKIFGNNQRNFLPKI